MSTLLEHLIHSARMVGESLHIDHRAKEHTDWFISAVACGFTTTHDALEERGDLVMAHALVADFKAWMHVQIKRQLEIAAATMDHAEIAHAFQVSERAFIEGPPAPAERLTAGTITAAEVDALALEYLEPSPQERDANGLTESGRKFVVGLLERGAGDANL